MIGIQGTWNSKVDVCGHNILYIYKVFIVKIVVLSELFFYKLKYSKIRIF